MKKRQPLLLDFDQASVIRGDRTALQRIDFQVGVRENVAVIGPNGSGKSTLIKTITRECYPSQGTVKILGQEFWDVFELRHHLGVVTHDTLALCTREITGREAVLSGFFSSALIWKNHHVTPGMEKKATKALKFLEVPHLATRFMTDLSSGEAQRILIARALVHNPLALVLDEPTTSLDFKATALFQRTLRKIAKSGKNIILVTHNLHDVIPEIFRVVLLKEGKIFKDGPKKAMLSSENLSNLFGTTVKLHEDNGYYRLN